MMDKLIKSAKRPRKPVAASAKRTAARRDEVEFHRTKGTTYPYIEFPRISRNPHIMGGKPCIRGMRVTVGMIAAQIGSGTTIQEMLEQFPYLRREDILEAIRYAGAIASDREIDLAGVN